MGRLLDQRYPGLSFLMRFSPPSKIKSEGGDEAVEVNCDALDQYDTIFIYGVGRGHYFDQLFTWLEASRLRELIFIEDDLHAILRLENEGRFDAIFYHPRTHLMALMPGKELEEIVREAIHQFPSDKIAVLATPSYEKTARFEILRMNLLRAATTLNAMQNETLYHHQLFANLIVNYRRIPQGFFANRLKGQFEKIPAIICGGGPSLAEIKEHFHAIEDKALIFAGGSGIAALTHLGLLPHFALAVDPNSTEWDLVKNNGAFEVPILFASRVFPKIFASLNGPTGYVQTLSGGASERLIEEKLSLQGVELEEEVDLNGMSVTTLAIAYAIALGCYPIILCGVDLSYADDKLYAEGVLDEAMNAQAASATSGRSNGQVFLREGIDGRLVKTAVKWLMEADWIASKSAKQSKPIVNCSKKGLKIKGLHHIPLEKAIDRYLNKEYDLRGWVHTEIEVAQIGIEKNEIVDQVLEKLYTSLKQIEAKLCEMILLIQKEKRMDHPKLILFQMDMREEFAFQNLMQGIEPLVLNRIKRASNRLDFFASEETQKEYALDCEEKKYKLMQKIVLEYIKIYKVEYMGIL